MRKTFAAVKVFMVVIVSSHAQGGGTLVFNTNPSQGAAGPFVFDCDELRLDSSYLGQMYTSDTQNGTFTAQGEAQRFGMLAGAVNAGADGMILSSVTVTSGNVSGGEIGFYQIRAWSGAFSSYEAAISIGNPNLAGISDAVGVRFGGGDPSQPSPSVDGFQSFTAGTLVCPEPTSLFLGAFGIAGLIASRRR